MPRITPVLENLTAAWTWPHRPTAIRHAGKEDKTYFGFVTSAGHAYIASYDHNRNEYEATFLREHGNSSDHAQTIVHVRPDGRIIAFVCAHTDDTFRWFISKEPEDISAFGPERSLANRSPRGGYSYPQPVYLADEGRIYLFCRRRAMEGEPGGRVWGVSISEDDGETFVHQPFPLLARKDANSPYTIMKGNGKDMTA
ncbi:MAG: BNR-4 repeat-containing protein [Thermoguttaceae bacterium]|jgi:hypothetical protein|nr:BNR-4 repeat-containing protein [Thermoguttaceae bacterium]